IGSLFTPAAMWSSRNEGIAAVPADSLVDGDHSIAVVAANRATAAKVVIIRRFMGSLPVECAPYIDPASLLSKVGRSRTLWRLFLCGSATPSRSQSTIF